LLGLPKSGKRGEEEENDEDSHPCETKMEKKSFGENDGGNHHTSDWSNYPPKWNSFNFVINLKNTHWEIIALASLLK
jgi:hypothetical protein